jgi:hypothetical protein
MIPIRRSFSFSRGTSAIGPKVPLIESDAYPFFFTPNDMASPLELIAPYKKREAVRDEQRGGYFERSTRF